MKAAEEMKREQKEVKLRMILQDYHRRNNYELDVINYWMFLYGEAQYTLETISSRTEANLY